MTRLLKTTVEVPLKAPKVTFRNGYWFYFDEVVPRIVVFTTAWSGREVVLIDDEIVSDQRNLFTLKNTHRFQHQGSAWTVTVAVTKLSTGEVTCTLARDGVQIGQSTRAYYDGQGRKRRLWRPFLIGLFCGFIAVLAAEKLGLFS